MELAVKRPITFTARLLEPARNDQWVAERSRQWAKGERTTWATANYFNGDPKQGLMRPAGDLADPGNKNITWETPMSMRSVDAECRLAVTLDYLTDDLEEPEVEA